MRKLIVVCLAVVLSMPVIFYISGNDIYASEQTAKQKNKRTNKKKTKKPTTSAEAQRQQTATEEEIRRTQEEIEANKQKIEHQLNQLLLLDADILESEKLISDISNVVNGLNIQIDSLTKEIDANEFRLALLRNNYLKAIKQLRMSKGKFNPLAFIFSSKNFSQAYRRLRYLQQFGRWRANKTAQIMVLQNNMLIQKEMLAHAHKEKNKMLAEEVKEKGNLIARQSEQKKLVGELRENGEALQLHLSAKQAEANNLRAQISVLIAEEQRKAEEEQRRIEEENARLALQEQTEQEDNSGTGESEPVEVTSTHKKKKKETQTSSNSRNYADARGRQRRGRREDQTTGQMPIELQDIITDFKDAKGKLPKPVAGRFKVVNQFGRHAHPDIPDVEYDNPGIDAEVAPGAYAQAVFEGKVSGIYKLKGFRTVIIISHGEYYTVYGNIDTPTVKTGEQVVQGQQLGLLFSDKSDKNRTLIHFEVWCSRDKLNPTEWIK